MVAAVPRTHADTRPLLYAPEIIARDGTKDIEPRIEDEITRSLATSTNVYGGFESFWDMRDKVIGVGAELGSLSRYTKRDFSDAQRAQFRALRDRRIKDLLRIEVYRPAPGLLSVRLDVYGVPTDKESFWVHRSAQWVAPCGAPDEQALDMLGDAARCLATGDCSTALTAHIDVSPGRVVGVNENVTLDGCASGNARQDALRWQWTRTADGQPSIGSTGRRWITRLGDTSKYEVKLEVCAEASSTNIEPSSATTTLETAVQPIANAGPPQQLENREAPIVIDLDGSASTGSASYRWEQLSGPIGTFQPDRLICERVKCRFLGPFPGVYEFRLTVRNGPFKAVDDTRVLVNPRVAVHIDTLGLKHMFPRHSIRLRAVTSADELDRSPLISWKIISPTRADDSIVDAPSASETRFTPLVPGNYTIELSVRGRKQTGTRELWAAGSDQVEIRVDNPSTFFYGDISAHFPVGADSVHTTFVPGVHLLTLFSDEGSFGGRYSIAAGALDVVRGSTFDLEGSFDLVSRKLLQQNYQGFVYLGYFGARHDARDVVEHGPELGWINAIHPLGYPIFTDFSLRWVLPHDMHLLFGVSIGIGRAINWTQP